MSTIWDEIEPYVRALQVDPKENMFETSGSRSHAARTTATAVDESAASTERGLQNEPDASAQVSLRPAPAMLPTGSLQPESAPPEFEAEREVVMGEIPQAENSDIGVSHIEALKMRYIVGKVVGKDLVDAESRLIAARGTVITRQIVTDAEREGKLVELIVNMVMATLEE